MKKTTDMKIEDFLLKHASENPISFHMPGHKGSEFYKRFGHDDFLSNFFDYDITEIEGADNLFQREGIIEATAKKYAELYGAKESFLLVNGTSCGLIAAILTAVKPGGKLIMARNSHKSVFNALTLGGIEPIYAMPELIKGWDVSGRISPPEIKKLLTLYPEADAVILPSPNYYGICSDIEKIAGIVHEFGKTLIVDQAHGAHLYFFNEVEEAEFPAAAERAGADIVVNSTHKTLASLTQSAVLNVCTDRVDLELLEDKLQMMESTSPSYLLMASLDINGSIIKEHGKKLFKEWEENLNYFYKEASKIEGLKIMENLKCLDRTKLNIDLSEKGYSGRQLEKVLIGKYGIYGELNTGSILMCMTGIGNRRADYEVLIRALNELSGMNPEEELAGGSGLGENRKNSETGRRKILEQVGKICAKSVIPYPPGIPLICPGETVRADHVETIMKLLENGEKVLGLTSAGTINVK